MAPESSEEANGLGAFAGGGFAIAGFGSSRLFPCKHASLALHLSENCRVCLVSRTLHLFHQSVILHVVWPSDHPSKTPILHHGEGEEACEAQENSW